MTIFKRTVPTLLLVFLSLLALASIGIAGGDDRTPPGFDAPQVAAVPPDAREALAVFDRPRTEIDAIPTHLAERLDRRAQFGMNPGLSRLSIGNATHSVYLVPASGRVCAVFTVEQGGNTMCPLIDDIVRGKVGPTTVGLTDRGIAIYGFVPDGVESVAVLTGEEPVSEEIAVERNAYYTVVPDGTPLRAVHYVGPEGPVEFEIVDPSLAFEQE